MKNKAITKRLLLAGVLSLSALPVYGDHHEKIEWQQLPAETRENLAPMEKRWDKLKPQQQHKLLRRAESKGFKNRAERWKQLSPEERKRITKARQRFKDMPPEKRKELRKRWENMTDEEKRAAKERRLKMHGKDKKRDNKKTKDK
jgi:excinuclease UvrABC ATPase subunit